MKFYLKFWLIEKTNFRKLIQSFLLNFCNIFQLNPYPLLLNMNQLKLRFIIAFILIENLTNLVFQTKFLVLLIPILFLLMCEILNY